MQQGRLGRLISCAAAGLIIGGCEDAKRDTVRDSAGADILVSDSVAAVLDVPLTAERFDQWQRAESSLASAKTDLPMVRLKASTITPRDLDVAVQRLEADPPSRRAIESSGLGVRDFVLTTLAIANAMNVRTRPGTAAFRTAGPENVALVTRNEDVIRRVQGRSRVHVDDEDSDEDTDKGSDTRKSGRAREDSDRDSDKDSDRDSEKKSTRDGKGRKG